MKMICSQSELADAVLKVQRAVAVKSSIPALEGVLLRAHGTELELCGYDLEMGIKTTIPAEIEAEGDIVLNAKTFSDIVRRLPDDSVYIELSSDNIVEIKCGYCEFSIIGISATDYPSLPEFNESKELTIQSTTLKSMIRQTIFAVAEVDAKPVHMGSLFDIANGKLTLVSVDGYRFALRTEPIDTDDVLSFVVPGKTLNEILRLIPDEDQELKMFLGSRHITFKIDQYSVISRLLSGDFLQYKSAIPSTSSTTAIINTREFSSSIERVSLLITDKLKSPVCCIFSDDQIINLSCATAIGRGTDKLQAQITGEKLEIGFNSKYLLDALRNSDTDQIKIEMTDSLGPMKIVPLEGESFVFLVLPVRLSSSKN